MYYKCTLLFEINNKKSVKMETQQHQQNECSYISHNMQSYYNLRISSKSISGLSFVM